MPAPAPTPAPTPPAYNPSNPFGGSANSGQPGGTPAINPRGNAPPPLPDVDADALLTNITRQQYRDYQRRFLPVEREYAEMLTDPATMNREIAGAGQRARQGFQVSNEITQREQQRYGLQLRPDQAQAMARMRAVGRTTTTTGAVNDTRTAMGDLQLSGMNAMSGYGRGLRTSSMDALSGVAGRQAGIDAANDQMEAQEDAGRWSTVGAGAMAGWQMSGYNAWGAAAGAAVGLGLTLLG